MATTDDDAALNGEVVISEGGNSLDARLLRIAAVFVLGSFMSILDLTIVNVAIKDLSRNFESPLATIQWVSTGYILALATVIPVTGWAADRFGTKRLYIASIALFVVGSALSGAAWSAGSLILFRAVQGLGGGVIIPAGMIILTHAAGPSRIGRIMEIVGVPMLLGPILGPITGGYFVDFVSWRWIFFINIPIGVVAIFAAARILEVDEPKPHDKLDLIGLLLLSPGLAAFVYGLAHLAWGRAFSIETASAVAIGVVLVLGFILHARNRKSALIDVSLFARHPVNASAITTFLIGTALFGLSFVTPLYLQTVHGKSAFEAGLLIAVQGLGAMITMPIAGRLTDQIGAGKVVLVGLTFFALGALGLSQTTAATPMWQIELSLFVTGLGSGSSLMPAMSGALGVLKRDEVARATSGVNVVLRVGASVGTALMAVVLTQELSRLLGFTGNEGGGLDAVRNIPPATQIQMLAVLSRAFRHTFLWSFGMVALAFVAALSLPRRKIEH